MNRNELRRLSRIRLKEARVLLKARCFDGAYYLCGYAVECALKACIARATRRYDFPDLEKVKASYTHHLTSLIKQAGLEVLLQGELAGDPDFNLNWAVRQGLVGEGPLRGTRREEKRANFTERSPTDSME